MNFLKLRYGTIEERELLILDEGGRFKMSQYTILHEIFDLTRGKLGMLLSGPDYFIRDMQAASLKEPIRAYRSSIGGSSYAWKWVAVGEEGDNRRLQVP